MDVKSPGRKKPRIFRRTYIQGTFTSIFVITKSSSITVAYPDLQIRGEAGPSDPELRGENQFKKKFFSALPASVLIRNKGGGGRALPPGPSAGSANA